MRPLAVSSNSTSGGVTLIGVMPATDYLRMVERMNVKPSSRGMRRPSIRTM
jgi:hypothetical protein